jgi:NAD(P)-dependent dehydrogenase (short-subunit alcohol dehydrogenase family)
VYRDRAASAANLMGHVKLDDLNREHRYSSWRAYGTSKLENILFTQELHRRHGAAGLEAAAFHPGVIASNFGANATFGTRLLYHTPLRKLVGMKSVEEGADTLLWLANTNPPTWASGGYYAERKPARMNPQAHDQQLARDLWDRSAELLGL